MIGIMAKVQWLFVISLLCIHAIGLHGVFGNLGLLIVFGFLAGVCTSGLLIIDSLNCTNKVITKPKRENHDKNRSTLFGTWVERWNCPPS